MSTTVTARPSTMESINGALASLSVIDLRTVKDRSVREKVKLARQALDESARLLARS